MYEVCYQLDDVIVKENVNCDKISIIDGIVYCGDDLIVDKGCFICATKIEETEVEIGLNAEELARQIELNTRRVARRGMLW